MERVVTKFECVTCEPDFGLALATQKLCEMAAGIVSPSDWWANVHDDETGALLYQTWFEKGMLHTWCAASGEEDETIFFL